MDQLKSCTSTPSSRCRLIGDANPSHKKTCMATTNKTSNQTSPTRWVGGRTNSMSQWHDILCDIWCLAKKLERLNDLQLFAETVQENDPLEIKGHTEILARAQLEIRRLNNTRYSPSRSHKRLV
jgi:hypothetical protein